MGVMTVMPRTGEAWTVDDLDRLPDDGLQYELLDGLLLDPSARAGAAACQQETPAAARGSVPAWP